MLRGAIMICLTGSTLAHAAIDFGAGPVVAPRGELGSNRQVIPAVWVCNRGDSAAAPRAISVITDGTGTPVYSESLEIRAVGPGDSALAEFPAWPLPHAPGHYDASFLVVAAGDTCSGNDHAAEEFVILQSPAPGWSEMPPIPLEPSGRPLKDGAWLAWDDATARIYILKGNKSGDFYSIDPAGGGWRALASMPAGVENKKPYQGATGIADNHGTLYSTKGNNTRCFYRYSAETDEWTRLADVPEGALNLKLKGGNDLAYVPGDSDRIYLLTGYKPRFLSYNVPADRWDELPGAPSASLAKWDKGSWLVWDGGDMIYAHKAKQHELYAWSISAGRWSSLLPGLPFYSGMTGRQKKAKDGSDAAFVEGSLYALKGGNTEEFWRRDPATGNWTECEPLPVASVTGRARRAYAGAGLVGGPDVAFAIKGNKTVELWRYVPMALDAGRDAQHAQTAERGSGSGPSGVMLASQDLAVGRAMKCLLSPHNAQSSRLAVYDASGRLVLTRDFGSSNPVTTVLPGLSPGVYIIRHDGAQASPVHKLVIGN